MAGAQLGCCGAEISEYCTLAIGSQSQGRMDIDCLEIRQSHSDNHALLCIAGTVHTIQRATGYPWMVDGMPGGGGGYSGHILVGVCPGTPKKGGLRCGHTPKRGVL